MNRPLRVAFTVYPSAFQAPGGGEVQLMRTKEGLEKLGVEVTLFNPWTDKLKDFDVLHVFGSVKTILGLIETAHALKTKIAMSTICWYSWKSAWGTYGTPKERFLSLSRHFVKNFFPFAPSMRKRMMELSDILLPNSQSEAEQLVRYFQVPAEKIMRVPNGVDVHFEKATPDLFLKKYGFKDFVLIVGRIEPRKNQLSMIKALKGTSIPIAIIGDPVPDYGEYYAACKKAGGANVYFLGSIPHHSDLMASAFAACDTFLLASWLETPGLAALEAGLAGAKVIITEEGATKEYFSEFATYVAPDDIPAIRSKTYDLFKRPKDDRLKDHIRKNFLWENAAKKTLEAYQKIVKP